MQNIWRFISWYVCPQDFMFLYRSKCNIFTMQLRYGCSYGFCAWINIWCRSLTCVQIELTFLVMLLYRWWVFVQIMFYSTVIGNTICWLLKVNLLARPGSSSVQVIPCIEIASHSAFTVRYEPKRWFARTHKILYNLYFSTGLWVSGNLHKLVIEHTESKNEYGS
jgi:hypothetical protein